MDTDKIESKEFMSLLIGREECTAFNYILSALRSDDGLWPGFIELLRKDGLHNRFVEMCQKISKFTHDNDWCVDKDCEYKKE